MKKSDADAYWMRVAVRESEKGFPRPNPHVGAVVVRDNRCVAKAHHHRVGGAHAEVAALVAAGQAAQDATLYVTLQPCNHHGRTPPCTDALLRSGVRRVVYAASDPTGHSDGTDAKLAAAGIEVRGGVLKEEAQVVLQPFLIASREKRPCVTLKVAATLDGCVAAASGDARWITGPAARRAVHRWRARCDGILTGAGTVLADNPRLDVRHVRGPAPLRIVADTHARTPVSSRIVGANTLVLHGPAARPERLEALRSRGVALQSVAASAEGLRPQDILRAVSDAGVTHLMVEAGPNLSSSFLGQGLVDHLLWFSAPMLLGTAGAVLQNTCPAPELVATARRLTLVRYRRAGDDMLCEGWLAPMRE